MSTHVIRRQLIDIEFSGSESDARALQSRMITLCESDLALALDRVLERFVGSGEHWTLDRIDVDAGEVSPGELGRIVATIAEDIERQLWARTPRTSSFTGGVTVAHATLAPPTADLAGNLLNDTPGYRSEAQSVRQVFLYFLEKGVLPWWYLLPHGKTLEDAIRDLWVQADASASSADEFVRALRSKWHSAVARKRLVRQFTSAFLIELLSAESAEAATAVRDVQATLEKHGLTEVLPLKFLLEVWESAFQLVFSERLVTPEVLVRTSLQALPHEHREKYSPALERIENIWGSTAKHELVKPRDLPESREAKPTLDLDDGIFAPCTGVVLLHPFLPQFFDTLGVTKNAELVQPDRALCLLHFLATGLRFAPEYELLVPKVLCNLPLDFVVNSHSALVEAEENECASLLAAVIRHWRALGNSSIENLRGSFLMRPGKLSKRDGEYLLQVETRGYDVLLDQVPWGFSRVKLPWMQKTLWVEWRF